jgi:hypothetical protein
VSPSRPGHRQVVRRARRTSAGARHEPAGVTQARRHGHGRHRGVHPSIVFQEPRFVEYFRSAPGEQLLPASHWHGLRLLALQIKSFQLTIDMQCIS